MNCHSVKATRLGHDKADNRAQRPIFAGRPQVSPRLAPGGRPSRSAWGCIAPFATGCAGLRAVVALPGFRTFWLIRFRVNWAVGTTFKSGGQRSQCTLDVIAKVADRRGNIGGCMQSTAYRLPVSETDAVLVTRRMTDQRNASGSNDGSTAGSGPWLVKRWMGVGPVSACTRVLHTCSALAMKRSFNCWKLAMPWASASSRNRSRMYLLNLSCFPRPGVCRTSYIVPSNRPSPPPRSTMLVNLLKA